MTIADLIYWHPYQFWIWTFLVGALIHETFKGEEAPMAPRRPGKYIVDAGAFNETMPFAESSSMKLEPKDPVFDNDRWAKAQAIKDSPADGYPAHSDVGFNEKRPLVEEGRRFWVDPPSSKRPRGRVWNECPGRIEDDMLIRYRLAIPVREILPRKEET